MVSLRTSLITLTAAGLALSFSYGCGTDASKPPPEVIGSGGASDAGGAGGSGNGGQGGSPIIDAPIPIGDAGTIDCTDPSDETDSDGDTIADQIEGDGDSDGDGILDKDDLDSDEDGIPDAEEASFDGMRTPCTPVLDSDGDNAPDFQDFDADNDGVLDGDEVDCGTVVCRVQEDCDNDGVIDLVEFAAQSDHCDAMSEPPASFLFFVLPFGDGPESKEFPFSTGVKEADIYFLIDTTSSMQAAIDNVKNSLDTKIIPTILNGDDTVNPPIKAIPGAFVGVGAFKDIPWQPWGDEGDQAYQHRFCENGDPDNDCVGGAWVYGNISPPVDNAGSFTAPDNVKTILSGLTASGGGDSPEGSGQAMYMAVPSPDFAFTGGPPTAPGGGIWSAAPANCDPGLLGRACFRPGKLPIIVLITDAPMHNGAQSAFNYDTGTKARTYDQVKDTLNAASAKIVGVPVENGTGTSARNDLRDLAEETGSLYYDPQFGGREIPLVTEPTGTGSVADEVVSLIGLLAGQGLNNVTTVRESYSCPGGKDCTGDGVTDPQYDNLIDSSTMLPFDAAQLVESVEPVEEDPPPYTSINSTTFFGVQGEQTVSFRVTANNTSLQTDSTVVVRALLEVQTPTGLALGGSDGVKVIYFVIPRYRAPIR